MLNQSFGIVGILGIARRAPAFSLAGIQKSHFLAPSQNFNFGTNSGFLIDEKQKCNSFLESNVFVQRYGGFRAFSTEVSKEPDQEKKDSAEFSGVWGNDQWSLIVGFPAGMLFQSIATKMKFFYKCISAVIIPWSTYSWMTGYISLNYLAATYGSVLLAPITLYAFSRALNRMTAYILMEKNNENIMIGHFSSFLKLKHEIIPIEDIIPETAASKMGRNIQGVVLTKKSNQNEWFYVPSASVKIFDKEKAERIFHNLDIFPEDVYKYKKE